MTQKRQFPEPTMRTIEMICHASTDLAFKKPKFERYLNEYRDKGIYCSRPKVLTEEKKRYYDALRKKNIERYVRKNRKAVDFERKSIRSNSYNENNSAEGEL